MFWYGEENEYRILENLLNQISVSGSEENGQRVLRVIYGTIRR